MLTWRTNDLYIFSNINIVKLIGENLYIIHLVVFSYNILQVDMYNNLHLYIQSFCNTFFPSSFTILKKKTTWKASSLFFRIAYLKPFFLSFQYLSIENKRKQNIWSEFSLSIQNKARYTSSPEKKKRYHTWNWMCPLYA